MLARPHWSIGPVPASAPVVYLGPGEAVEARSSCPTCGGPSASTAAAFCARHRPSATARMPLPMEED